MKPLLVLSMFSMFLFTACYPKVLYLGETYDSVQEVDVYYHPDQLEREHRVIGTMTNNRTGFQKLGKIKASMIEEAQRQGANGIVFTDLTSRLSEESGLGTLVKAQLVRYK